MTEQERLALRERYKFRCGYCGVSEEDAGCIHTTDHFQPSSRGGSDDEANRVYCCHTCNEFKGSYWNPHSVHRILHPLDDPIGDHIEIISDGFAVGLTLTGRFHIDHLQLNRKALVAHRLKLAQLDAAERRNVELLERLSKAEARIASLSRRLGRLKRD